MTRHADEVGLLTDASMHVDLDDCVHCCTSNCSSIGIQSAASLDAYSLSVFWR